MSLQRVQHARARLVLNDPFFGVLALRLKLVESEKIDTMATDGQHLLYNAEYTADLSDEHVMGVVAHEVMHCAMLHMTRRGDRDATKWNIACDYAIDHILHDAGYRQPDDGKLLDAAHFNGLSAEEIYNLLPNKTYRENFGCGGVLDAPDGAEAEAEWAVAVRDAVAAAKAAGKCRGSFEELVTLTAPVIDWRTQLFNVLTSFAKSDYSWYPPDTQYLTRRLHVPSLSCPTLGKVVWFEDTSGSMSSRELAASRSEFMSILEQLPCQELVFMQGDTTVIQEVEVEDFDDVGFNVVGRGGTDFTDAFNRARELSPDVMLCFTDMEPNKWPDQPDFEVVWLRTQRIDAPYGRYIDVRVD